MNTDKQSKIGRKLRVRASLRRKSAGRLRLTVCRSSKHIYAQIIDDVAGKTLVSASTIDKDFAKKSEKISPSTIAAASRVGQLIAEKAGKAGIKEVVFDRGSYMFHGRVKALAEAARSAGLSF